VHADNAADPGSVDELLQYLQTLHTLLKKLEELANEKLAALRKADSAALVDCAAREGVLIRDVLFGQQQRDALLARVAQRLPADAGEVTTVSALAQHFSEPISSSLRARGAALRAVAIELRRKNNVVSEVARNLQAHIHGIFTDVANASQETLVYGAKGNPEKSRTRFCVDATG
jgi:hypothetical protein